MNANMQRKEFSTFNEARSEVKWNLQPGRTNFQVVSDEGRFYLCHDDNKGARRWMCIDGRWYTESECPWMC